MGDEMMKYNEVALLAAEEATTRHVMAKAELRWFLAKKNLILARTTEPTEIEAAQRDVEDAKNREAKARLNRTAARDEWKRAEEQVLAATGEIPSGP
jgi:hypothetical protein